MNDVSYPQHQTREFHAETPLRILFCHWGRGGAGWKIAFDCVAKPASSLTRLLRWVSRSRSEDSLKTITSARDIRSTRARIASSTIASSVPAGPPDRQVKTLSVNNVSARVDEGGCLANGASCMAGSPTAGAITERTRNILLWHWGRVGPGSKMTYELARELYNVSGIDLTVSGAEGSQLAELARSDANIVTRNIKTFQGDKTALSGKLRAALGLLGLPRVVRDFRRILSEQQIEVAICTMPSIWDVAALTVLRGRKSRYILVMHDAKLHPGDHYPMRETVHRLGIETADALIVLTDHVGRAAQDLYGFPAHRIWTVPHGRLSFDAGIAAPRAFPSRPIRLLFFGRIVKYKGLGHLLDAYRILRRRNIAVELDIVGSGDLAPYKPHLAGLPDVTITNTWVDEEKIAQALTQADIVVLPYLEASQSGVAASALTAGLPIVATPVGGLVEQVRCGETGIIAKGMQAEDLAAAVQRFIDDPALYETCSAGALRHAREELGWRRIANRVADIVAEVASQPRRKEEQ